VEMAEFYKENSEMWRITDDFWDKWELLLNMFERCRNWQDYVMDGSYPDCDMLPLGYVGKGFGNERKTNFTKDEQITMMTLWCIFRSPLMIGAELTKLDDFSLQLLTNDKALHLLENSHGAREIKADENIIVWTSEDNNGVDKYVAVFNVSETDMDVNISELSGIAGDGEELWSGESVPADKELSIAKHGAVLVKVRS
ncbi:MAG: alpha-galactosidase, partial [Lachnospiraceae bacterium]|nr:alpha-galactosidase [Lachnospiraceae bacterium]